MIQRAGTHVDAFGIKRFHGVDVNEIGNELMAQRRSRLSSRTSRLDLDASDQPKWEVISAGVRLGYRKGRGTRGRGGTWLAASRNPAGVRVQVKLGQADDVLPADGEKVLSSEQARERARSWAKSVRTSISAPKPSLTVGDVLDRWLEAREAEGMKSAYDARSRIKIHIRPALGAITLIDLTADRIIRWRNAMVKAPKLLRTAMGAKQRRTKEVAEDDAEGQRRRRDTANRTLTVLKAALNWARDHRLTDDDTSWRSVKPFKATTAARVRFLDTAEQKQLLKAADGSLRDLLAAALMTGARFGELARLQVRDFDTGSETIFIGESKSGKARHVALTAGGAQLFARLSKDRGSEDLLLMQADGRGWRPASYQRSFKAVLAKAKLPAMTLHELRHSYASTMVRAGAPLMVVARALGHADTRMAEKHYAHLAPSYVADTIRKTAPDLEA